MEQRMHPAPIGLFVVLALIGVAIGGLFASQYYVTEQPTVSIAEPAVTYESSVDLEGVAMPDDTDEAR